MKPDLVTMNTDTGNNDRDNNNDRKPDLATMNMSTENHDWDNKNGCVNFLGDQSSITGVYHRVQY